MQLPTMEVICTVTGERQIINESDFDEECHITPGSSRAKPKKTTGKKKRG